MATEKSGRGRSRVRCLKAIQGPHRFFFFYHEGEESELMVEIARQAADPENPLGWGTAMDLAFKIGSRHEAAFFADMLENAPTLD